MIVGIIKPKGPTSHDIIDQVRRITHERRVGHAGTLDPMASGVLVIAITRQSTKQLHDIVNHDKEYVATIHLGGTSTTDDAEGTITEDKSKKHEVHVEQILNAIQNFVGEIKQIPPQFSAIKKGGQKSYDLARQGKIVDLGSRDVVIHSIEVVSYLWPTLIVKVHCGKGVYIRSIARDIGNTLGTGGYLTALERTRIGEFRIENCLTLTAFEKIWHESHNH